MTVLNVTYHLKPGMRDAFIKAISLQQISRQCLQEPGCEMYSFCLPASPEDRDTLYLQERYADDEAFAFHKQQAHFLRLQQLKTAYVEETQILISHA